MSNTTTDDCTKPLILGKGFFLVPEFSATGGVKYTRRDGHEEQTGERLEAEFTTTKVVDHVGLLKWSRKIINLAYNAMERHASQTPIGYWVPADKAEAIMSEMAGVSKEAQSFNTAAHNVGSGRRVRIATYPITMREDDESAAIRLAQTVRERLVALVEALRLGDLDGYATAWKRARNLPRLATGIQAEAVGFALEAAKEGRAQVAAAIRGDADTGPVEPGKAGEAVNLDALESAIVLFTDSVNGSLNVVTDESVG